MITARTDEYEAGKSEEELGKIITILGVVLEVLFLALLFFTFAANRMF